MVWTTIPNSNLEPGAPARSVDALALRDNPEAIANGDSGAPRIQTAAIANQAVTDGKLGTSATSTGRNWITDRYVLVSAGGVGTYAFAILSVSNGVSFGETQSGSNLTRAAVYYDTGGDPQIDQSGGSLSGTWRAMGESPTDTGGDRARAMIWLRIS